MGYREPSRSFRLADGLLLLSVVIVLAISFALFSHSELRGDEIPHYEYVLGYLHGSFTHPPDLTTPPGYHLLLAGMGALFGKSDPLFFRLVNLILAVFSLFVFALLSREISPSGLHSKLLQFAFLPLLFPFYFLIYTDVLSLLLVLLASLLLLRGNHRRAGLAGFASLLVRQNNIVWLAFFAAHLYVAEHGMALSLGRLRSWLAGAWPYLAGIVLFGVFVAVNGGVALGDAAAHPFPHLSLTNVYFLLFLAFFLFLPLHLANAGAVLALLRRKWTIVLLAAGFPLFLATFTNTHAYNVQWTDYFLRNWLLVTFTSSIWLKTLFFFPAAYAALSIAVTPLCRKGFWLLYPITVLLLVFSWLVEQRYYIIPLAFFILFKKERSALVEYTTIAYFVVASGILLHGIRQGAFFL